MGLETYFTEGQHFTFNKPVEKSLLEYVNKWADVRHMLRDVSKIKATIPNWKDLCYKGDLGEDGEFFIGGGDDSTDDTVVDANNSGSVPALNCGWKISEDGTHLEAEYGSLGYIYMLRYMIDKFFAPNGYVLNGTMDYEDEAGGQGAISAIDNAVSYTGPATGNDYWAATSLDILEKYGCSSDDYFDPLGEFSGDPMLHFDTDGKGSAEDYKHYSYCVEVMLILRKKDADLKDYRDLAENLAPEPGLHPVAISSFTCDVDCKTTGKASCHLTKGSLALFVNSYFDEKLLRKKLAKYQVKVVVPNYGEENCINDEVELDCDKSTCLCQKFSHKWLRSVYNFGLFTVESYTAMQIHCHNAQIIFNDYIYSKFADRDNENADFFEGFAAKPRGQVEAYDGCYQFFYDVHFCKPDIDTLFREGLCRLLMGDLEVFDSENFDAIEEMTESITVSKASKGEMTVIMPYEVETDAVSMALSELENVQVEAEEFESNGFYTRTAYLLNEDGNRTVLGNEGSFGPFRKNLQAFADAYARLHDGLPLYDEDDE